MDDAREHWTTTLTRAVGLVMAGFLLMGSLAVLGSVAGHARELARAPATDDVTAQVAPDAIRRTAQLLDTPSEPCLATRAISSLAPFARARESGR